MLTKDEQLLQARQSLAEKARQVELLREEQNKFNKKFMEQLRVKDESWKNRCIHILLATSGFRPKSRVATRTGIYRYQCDGVV
jgi:hypothetical protein